MNALYFVLCGVAVFLSVLLGGKNYRNTALYALSIGGVVNANFFHAGNYPIYIFDIPFGIDSIIYTLFVFCVIVMQLTNNKKQAYILLFSSVVAIVFSALMQLMASVLSVGSSTEVWATFLGFLVSSVATIIAVCVMIEVIEKLKNKNWYFCTIIGILIASIINSGIYYPISLLINGVPYNIAMLLLSSFIGKCFSILLALFTLFVLKKWDNKYATKD